MTGKENVHQMGAIGEVKQNLHSEMTHANFVLIHMEIEFLETTQMKIQKCNAGAVVKYGS
jgi:hypothetical protein